MQNNFILLGIDGGASKVSAWQVLINADNSYSLGEYHAEKSYRDIPGFIQNFKAVDLATQLAAQSDPVINTTEEEKQQAAVYVEACAVVIEEILEKSGQKRLAAGIGMPGLKTADKRGIAVVANGPRMVDYAEKLEARLKLRGIEFITPIAHLGSDADYCGIGENYSAEGLFRDSQNAYYLGGGTGAADALKLKGQLVAFDAIKPWMAKTWEMKADDERSLERFASASGIQSIYAHISGQEISELNNLGIYPMQLARLVVAGDVQAVETFKLVVDTLAKLIYERITTLYSGWQKLFNFVNPNKPALSSEHPYLGTLLDKIILGQRLGDLLESGAGKITLREPLIERLQQLINASDILDETAKNHYAAIDELLHSSKLREAPALGAGIDADLAGK